MTELLAIRRITAFVSALYSQYVVALHGDGRTRTGATVGLAAGATDGGFEGGAVGCCWSGASAISMSSMRGTDPESDEKRTDWAIPAAAASCSE